MPALPCTGYTKVGGNLEIGRNDALTNFDGLSNLTSAGGFRIYITNNNVLPTAKAEALVAQLTAFTGEVNISGNPDWRAFPGPMPFLWKMAAQRRHQYKQSSSFIFLQLR